MNLRIFCWFYASFSLWHKQTISTILDKINLTNCIRSILTFERWKKACAWKFTNEQMPNMHVLINLEKGKCSCATLFEILFKIVGWINTLYFKKYYIFCKKKKCYFFANINFTFLLLTIMWSRRNSSSLWYYHKISRNSLSITKKKKKKMVLNNVMMLCQPFLLCTRVSKKWLRNWMRHDPWL